MENLGESAKNQRKDRSALWALIGVLIGFGLPALFCLGTLLAAGLSLSALGGNLSASTAAGQEQQTGGPASGPAVAELDLNGVITGGTAGLFPVSSLTASDDLIGQIQAASKNPDVKALVLRVDSPGGDVVASDEIYHALKTCGKPLVVLIGAEGASGAYYVSMAAAYIIANPDSLTGSIGVISEVPNAQQLLDKLGVQVTVIKSGAEKDIGSPYRPMSDADKAIMQGIIDQAYGGFVTVVANGRHLPREKVLQLADGRVFTGQQALQLGLVDALGYEEDAIAKAAQLGKISGTPRVIHYGPGPSLLSFFSSMANTLSPQALALDLLGQPSLQYRWTP
ncbi:MAG: signal peptide peptidase SppA [Anaerolineales bacterium]|jgi:protease-4